MGLLEIFLTCVAVFLAYNLAAAEAVMRMDWPSIVGHVLAVLAVWACVRRYALAVLKDVIAVFK